MNYSWEMNTQDMFESLKLNVSSLKSFIYNFFSYLIKLSILKSTFLKVNLIILLVFLIYIKLQYCYNYIKRVKSDKETLKKEK